MRHIVDRAPYVERRVVRIPHKQIRAVRNQMSHERRDEFRRFFHAPYGAQIHHVLPISLGGGNDWSNLVLICPVLHDAVHEFIDEQIEDMEVGETRKVIIPIISQRKLWVPYHA